MKTSLQIKRQEAPLLRDVVADKLREAIIRGVLPPNEHVSERWLSEMLDVSVSPIKEALKTLEMEGLVKSVPRKGTLIIGLDPKRMEENAILRASLEGVAAYLAAQKITPEQLTKLESACDAIIELSQRVTATESLVEASDRFHNLIAVYADNDYLLQLIESLRRVVGVNRLSSWYYRADANLSVVEHGEILEALKKGDADEAKLLMENHILRSIRTILDSHEATHKDAPKTKQDR